MNTLVRLILFITTAILAGCTLPNTVPAPYGNNTGPSRCGEGGPRWKADGMDIAYRYWPARGHARGVIAAATGWDSDACDWTPLARSLAERGYDVYVTGRRSQWGDPRVYRGNDLQKYARRGDIDDWTIWAKDYAAFTRWVASQYPTRPLFYGAQSLGSNEVLTVAGDLKWHGAPVRGVFIISPGLPYMYPTAQLSLMNSLGPLFLRQKYRMSDIGNMVEHKKDGKPDPIHLMNDPAEWHRWSHSADRVHEGFTTRWLGETMHMGSAARQATKHITCPVFLYHGQADQLLIGESDQFQSNAWDQFQREFSTKPTICDLAGGNHMPFADTAVESQIFFRLSRWLDHTLAAASRN